MGQALDTIGLGVGLGMLLTGVCLEQAVGAPEVLRVLDDGDLRHADDYGVGAHLRGGWRVTAVGDVVEGRSRVVVVADDR